MVPASLIMLPCRLDSAALLSCLADLLERRGAPLILDGSAVERLGGQGLQLLLSAFKTWREDGQPLRLQSASEALLAGMRQLGIDPETLEPADGNP
ncbi:hypothetical protein BZG35_16715 [Brevundimonas sp. LM2]|nr:hypothetical protein BZG35_16715 [Brevundimonas sp. LM2]